MTTVKRPLLEGWSIAVSVSDSPDLAVQRFSVSVR